MSKRIAVYGTYVIKVLDEIVLLSGRYEFHGSGKDIYKAVMLAQRYMPKGVVEVDAKEFLDDPEEYGYEGEWVDREVES